MRASRFYVDYFDSPNATLRSPFSQKKIKNVSKKKFIKKFLKKNPKNNNYA
jgi:hypothetical protein